jgi:uncharacterized protein DUF1707/2TM domain-containing protein
MTAGAATFSVTSMPPTSLRADGSEPTSRLTCRQAHPTFGGPPAYPAGNAGPPVDAPAYPVDRASYPSSGYPMGAPPAGWPPRPAPGPDGDLRIGDRERQMVADELRTHFTAGRIDIDEFSSRLGEVWAATTATDLWTALRQLPPVPGQPRPWDVPRAGWSDGPTRSPDRRRRPHGVAHTMARAHLRTYLTVAAILVGIWLLTTPGGYFWPAWPLLFWGWFVFLHHRTTRRWEEYRARRA